MLCGCFGGIIGAPFLIRYDPIGLLLPLVGCSVGGLIYRIRSRDWPIDPSVPARRWRYVLSLLILIPGTIFLLVGVRAQGAGMVMIGGIVAVAVSSGILISGNRRDGESNDQG